MDEVKRYSSESETHLNARIYQIEYKKSSCELFQTIVKQNYYMQIVRTSSVSLHHTQEQCGW